jgi:DNA-binding MarR family transcriptional regulator
METKQTQPQIRVQGRAVPLWLRLARVFSKLERALAEEMRGRTMSMAQFDVVAHVGAAEGMTQQELADRLLVTKGNVCQLVDRLEHSGLLVRQQEGRANRLFLTDAGRALFASSVPAHEARIGQLLGALSAEEQAELLRLLRKLDHAL